MSHTTSRFFLILKIALVASVIVAIAWGWQQLKDPENFPINHVKVQASYEHTDQATLASTLTPYVNQGFFGFKKKDLIRAIFNTTPWIAEVKISRNWPDGLQIIIAEQIPVAQWEKKALINAAGVIFYANPNTFPDNIPILTTNEQQVPELLKTYEKMRVILSTTPMDIIEINASDREAITLTLNNGTQLIVGRQDQLPRLQRFVKAYPKIAQPNEVAEKIDLRYRHGLSIKWRDNP